MRLRSGWHFLGKAEEMGEAFTIKARIGTLLRPQRRKS